MKARIFAVCFSLIGLTFASQALAQNIGDFFLGGGWTGQTVHPGPGLPPEKAGDYKPLAENLKKQLPEGADLRESASGFRNLGDFVSAVHASNNLQIPFREVKARMVNGGNLVSAIAALRPEMDASIEARKARAAAHAELRQI